MVPRLDARHRELGQDAVTRPLVAEEVLVGTVGWVPPRHVDASGRRPPAGDCGAPGPRPRPRRWRQRRLRGRGRRRRRRGVDRSCRRHRDPAPSPCRRASSAGPTRARHRGADPASTTGPGPRPMSPRSSAARRSRRVGAPPQHGRDVVRRRKVAVGGEADEAAIDPHEPHRVRGTDAEERPPLAPRRRHRERAPVDAGRIGVRHLRRLAGERHPHVEVDRRRRDPAGAPTRPAPRRRPMRRSTSPDRHQRRSRRRRGIAQPERPVAVERAHPGDGSPARAASMSTNDAAAGDIGRRPTAVSVGSATHRESGSERSLA